MDSEFWQNAWKKGDPGWRQSNVNSRLQRFHQELQVQPGERIFVPLCGDSIDLLWLAEQGYNVVGIELSELAVRRFFTDHDLPYKLTMAGQHQLYTASIRAESVDDRTLSEGNLQIFCGDFFTLNPTLLGDVAAVYDRAATVAMPADLRVDYARQIKSLLSPGTPVLLISMSYDQSKMNGPPFSVSHDNVNNLFADAFDIDVLSQSSGPEILGNLADRGLDTLEETVYKLTRNKA